MDKVKDEVWKEYPDYPFIEGSSLGRVRTIDRYVTCKNGRKRFVKGQVLTQRCDKDGYLYVVFSVNGKSVYLSAHRFIAECFLPNPLGLPQVNHKDCNRTNNCVGNLEWCTSEYNNAYREKYGKALGCPVYAVNLNTLEVSQFESQQEADRALGIDQSSISAVTRGQYKQTHGYWFTNDNENAVEATRGRFDDVVAYKVKKLMDNREVKVEQQWLNDFVN